MNEPTILISCPVRDRAWVLPSYLEHIYNLDYPKNKIGILWVINQSTDNSYSILSEFKKKHQHEYKYITIKKFISSYKMPKDERTTTIRRNHIHEHLAEIRNFILKNIGEFDYLLSCDSDILISKNTITKLLSSKKDVCAGIIYNGYHRSPDKPWKYPNILLKDKNDVYNHISNFYVKNSPTLRTSKLVRVDATGAIALISKKVCQNTSYSAHIQGEDIGWSIDCKDKGYSLYADYSAYSFHAMDIHLLKQYLNKNKGDCNE